MLKLLIINDNLKDRTQIKKCFGDYDVFIYTASDVETGFGIHQKYSPEIIIIDLDISGYFTGIEFFDLLTGDIPIIFIMSSQLKFSELEYCLSKGADSSISKPINCENIVTQVDKLCWENGLDFKRAKVNLLKRWENPELSCLIVNDGNSDRITLPSCKEIRGVTSCDGPEEALGILKHFYKQTDFILMDWRHPIDNSLEFIERIKKTPCTSNIPIILVKGDNAKDMIIKAMQKGVDNFIFYPILIEDLLKKVGEVLP